MKRAFAVGKRLKRTGSPRPEWELFLADKDRATSSTPPVPAVSLITTISARPTVH
ncbi:MAG: hypothetical protein AB2A00_43050 [Myxococcota bacterium]